MSDNPAISSQKTLTNAARRSIIWGVDVDPRDSERRHAALDAFGPDPFAATAFEDLTRVAADLLGAPMAAISVLTRAGAHFKATIGIAGGKRSTDALATWALSHPQKGKAEVLGRPGDPYARGTPAVRIAPDAGRPDLSSPSR